MATLGITAQADQDGAGWAIWVRDENDVPRAREELSIYQQDPTASRYHEVGQQARRLRDEELRRQRAAARRTIDMRRHWARPMVRQAPLVMTLIGLCVVVALTSNFGSNQKGTVMRALSFCDPVQFAQTRDGLQQIRHGQLWRLVTPVFLHFGVIHLVFNLLWLYYLGAQVEMRRGTWVFAGIVLTIAVLSNLLQYFAGRSPMFLGISGVNYGLLGYIWMRKRFDPRSGFVISDSTIMILLLFLILGFVGAFDQMLGAQSSVANWAHAGGLGVGVAMGYAPIWWQR